VPSLVSRPPSLQNKETPALLAGNLPNAMIHHHFSYYNFFHTYYHAFLISLSLSLSLSLYALSSKYWPIKLSKGHIKPPHFVRPYTYTVGTRQITHSKFK
jgi:hypothetical protein